MTFPGFSTVLVKMLAHVTTTTQWSFIHKFLQVKLIHDGLNNPFIFTAQLVTTPVAGKMN